MSAKILTLDIETAPISAYVWALWDQNVGLDMIADEWTILSFSAKWLDKKEPIFKGTGGRGKIQVRDDKELCQALWKLLDEADIVITQNGKSFDIKKINARLISHGIGPYSPIKIVDTMLVAKHHFAFTSNNLNGCLRILIKVLRRISTKSFQALNCGLSALKTIQGLGLK